MTTLQAQLNQIEFFRESLNVKEQIIAVLRSPETNPRLKSPIKALLNQFDTLSSPTFVLLGKTWLRTTKEEMLKKAQKKREDKEALEKAKAIYLMLKDYTLGIEDLDGKLSVVKIAFRNFRNGKKPVESPRSIKECVMDSYDFLNETYKILGGFDRLRDLYRQKNTQIPAETSSEEAKAA